MRGRILGGHGGEIGRAGRAGRQQHRRGRRAHRAIVQPAPAGPPGSSRANALPLISRPAADATKIMSLLRCSSFPT